MSSSDQKKTILLYCLAAAIPLFLLAFIFNFSLIFTNRFILWTDQELLGYIIQAEFLAAASGILIILPLLLKTEVKFLRIFRMLLFIFLATSFSWLAFDIAGLEGMLFYSLLVFVTFGGGTLFVFDWYCSATRAFLSLLRWSMGIFLYVTIQLNFNLGPNIDSWGSSPDVIPFGASFFYVLFLLELVLYPPLTYYLERKHAEDTHFSERIKKLP